MDEHAAIGAWQSVVGEARLEPMDKVHNAIWRVVAEDGRTWVLKHLPEYAPGAGPVESYRVLCYLQSCGLPVAVPVITDDGLIAHNAENLRPDRRQKHPNGKDTYALIPLLANDPELRESPELAHTIGVGIGRLDRTLAACPWPVTSYTDDPAAAITELYPRLPDELRSPVAPFRDRLFAASVDLPTQRTHGDCNAGNVLVHDGSVTGFIDVDHLPMGPRVRDLSYYLASRFVLHVAGGNPDALLALLHHYVAGYRSEHPLTEREVAAVVPLLLAIELGVADWCLHGWVPDPAGYARALRTIEWLTDRYDELAAAVLPG